MEKKFRKYILKISIFALIDALVLFFCIMFILNNDIIISSIIFVATILLNWLGFSKKSYPLRYLLPGLIFMIAMVVVPIGYNIYISFTNYSTGYIVSKDQAIKNFMNREYFPENGEKYDYIAYGTSESLEYLLLHNENEKDILVDMEGNVLDLNEIKHSYDDSEFSGNIDNFYALDHKEIFKNIKELQNLKVTYLNGWLRLGTLKEFYYYIPQYIYDSKKDILIDNKTERIYRVKNAQFVSDDGEMLDPGWTEVIGFQNYIRLLTTEKYRKPFFSVFLWTIEWSVLTVFFSFVIGLGLALLLNDPKIKMRKFYRSLLILPYAMPAFISLLIWRYGFYNSDFGLFNKILNSMFNITIPWLNSPGWARFSVILTNVWLTFPYMMLVSLGALQAVPNNLLEAARIDGANGFQRFRKITFPLIMISIAPLLIGSFATTFNNFTVIWLLTEGNPITGIGNVSGATDILISYAYKLAFVGKAGNELGLSSAVAVVIFLIVVTISVLSFRRTKVLEEVADEL